CSALGQRLWRAGNETSDSVCGGPDGDTSRRELVLPPVGVLPRRSDPTSVSLWVLCTLLFVVAFATTVCLLQGARSGRQALHVSCFKRVFKSCVVDPEAHLPDHHSPDAARSEDFLFLPAPTVGTEAPPLQEPCLASPQPSASPSPQEELLRGRAQEPPARPAANQPATEVVTVAAGQGAECGGEQAAGFVGPVFIYNPACVYMGLIQSRDLTDPAVEEEEEGEEGEAAVEESGEEEARSLPYPQQEAGGHGTLRQTSPRPEQETGKGEHLSEEASEVP
ncbi:uncharacterized protein, partial [Mobula birostris]|uniref:uncharacterized protein n=1 Tax=Mobula birostris TaxID=1983395 RepID=UPI003B27D6FD